MGIKGYNLYLEGPSGVGKTMYTKKFLASKAAKEKVPNDWCYIYNFDNPNEPIAVSLPAGEGKIFVQTMDTFVSDVKKYLKKTFNNDDFEKEKAPSDRSPHGTYDYRNWSDMRVFTFHYTGFSCIAPFYYRFIYSASYIRAWQMLGSH